MHRVSGRAEVHTAFWWGKLRERDHLVNQGVYGKIILRWIFRMWDVGVCSGSWIELAQDRDRWRALVNAVMKLRVQKNVGNFSTSCEPVSFSRRTMLHGESMELTSHRGLVMFLAGMFTDVTAHLT
jgi:hypothetical protein